MALPKTMILQLRSTLQAFAFTNVLVLSSLGLAAMLKQREVFIDTV
jgi:hypothetical protein